MTALSSRCRLALVGLILTGLAPLAAQAPADRAALDAFRDSLADLTREAEIRAAGAGPANGPVKMLRQGLAALRRGELGDGRRAYDDAIQQCERAIDAEGKWPYPWYALGLVQLGMYQRAFLAKASNYSPSGASYREAAMRSFGKAIEQDSTFLPASSALAGVTASLGHRLLPKWAREPLRRAQLVPGGAPEISLALARYAFGAGEYEQALESLGDYLRRGGDQGVGRVEQARILVALGRGSEAAATYLAGLKDLTESGRLAYREDLAWVAGADELRAYDSLPAAELHPWVGRFWRERDALSLRTVNERLSEHLRRWVHAHQNYLLHRPDDVPANAEGFGPQDQASLFEIGAVSEVMTEVAGGIPAFKTYRRTQWEIDDRGVLYLRHGAPTRRVSSVAGPPNESWAYDLPEGRRIFHFLGSRALGTQAATTLTATLPLNPDMLDARADLDARYAILASRIQSLQAAERTRATLAKLDGMNPEADQPNGSALAADRQGATLTRLGADFLWREAARNRTAIAAAVATDGYPLHYKSSLDAIVQVYGVGFGPSESPRILAVFAVPGSKLTPRPRPDGGTGVLYPVAIRLIALDRSTGTMRQLDTTRTFLARDTLRGDQHLTGMVELPVPPGFYQVRALLSQGDTSAGTGVGRDSISIPASPEELMLSDLILGQAGSGLVWPYGGDRVPLNPLNAFPRGADADLFYEIGGLRPGATYTVTTSVRKAEDKPTAKPEVQISFEFTAGAPYQRVRRGLGLAHLRSDNYLLEVTVREAASGREARRARALNILSR